MLLPSSRRASTHDHIQPFECGRQRPSGCRLLTARLAGDVDDAPVAVALHQGHQRLAELERAVHIRLYRLSQGRQIELQWRDAFVQIDGSVVDQHVGPAIDIGHVLYQPPDARGVGHVELVKSNRQPFLLHRGSSFPAPRFVPRREQDVKAERGEVFGGLPPDSPVSSCHDGDSLHVNLLLAPHGRSAAGHRRAGSAWPSPPS